MNTLLRELVRLEAYRTGRAAPVASHLRVRLQPDARLLIPMALANEHRAFQVVVLDRLDGPVRRPRALTLPTGPGASLPAVAVAGDARRPEDATEVFDWLAAELLPWFETKRGRGFPQLVVPSEAAWELVREAALFIRTPRPSFPRPAVERLGEMLSFFVERRGVPGQQSVVVLTEALCDHWLPGVPDADTSHLGVDLLWFSGHRPCLADVEAAEGIPMGVRTRPEFDAEYLVADLAAVNAARRRHEAAPTAQTLAALATARRRLTGRLVPVVANIHLASRRAAGILWGSGLPELPALSEPPVRRASSRAGGPNPKGLVGLERVAWEEFLGRRDDGDLMARRAPRWQLLPREGRLEAYIATLVVEDRYARASARLAGEVLVGRVTSATTRRVANPDPRKSRLWWETTIVVVSHQDVLTAADTKAYSWLARGVEAAWQVPTAHWVVTGPPARTGATIEVTLRALCGVQPPAPAAGTEAEFLQAARLSFSPFQPQSGPMPPTHTRVWDAAARRYAPVVLSASAGPPLPAHLVPAGTP